MSQQQHKKNVISDDFFPENEKMLIFLEDFLRKEYTLYLYFFSYVTIEKE